MHVSLVSGLVEADSAELKKKWTQIDRSVLPTDLIPEHWQVYDSWYRSLVAQDACCFAICGMCVSWLKFGRKVFEEEH